MTSWNDSGVCRHDLFLVQKRKPAKAQGRPVVGHLVMTG